MPRAFLTQPRPNGEVVALLERALANARMGNVRAVTITAINAVNEVDTDTAGVDKFRRPILIGGLVQAVHQLTRTNLG